MIKELSIENFKVYNELTNIPLSRINLLTGVNGRGKSTTLQAILIFAQSAYKNRLSNTVTLNGECVVLGNSEDIKNKETVSTKPTEFTFRYEDFTIKYSLKHPDEIGSELNIQSVEVGMNDGSTLVFHQDPDDSYIYELQPPFQASPPVRFTLFDLFIDSHDIGRSDFLQLSDPKKSFNLNYVHYVTADRIGPKSYYETKTLGHFISVGARGEEVVNVLHKKSNDQVNPEFYKRCLRYFRLKEEETSKTITTFVDLWLDAIFPGAGIKIDQVAGEEILKLRIKTDERSGFYKPTNVGYGFSYFLPILVAGLIAKPGEILIVENPEAHLHPSAQSILARFLAYVSLCDVQVFIESHSEHILNGLRICVYDQELNKDELNILYFSNQHEVCFEEIEISDKGGVESWPSDFFDQSTKDLNYLFGL